MAGQVLAVLPDLEAKIAARVRGTTRALILGKRAELHGLDLSHLSENLSGSEGFVYKSLSN